MLPLVFWLSQSLLSKNILDLEKRFRGGLQRWSVLMDGRNQVGWDSSTWKKIQIIEFYTIMSGMELVKMYLVFIVFSNPWGVE